MYNCSDNYVIRIYRRGEKDPQQVVGLVELVDRAEARSFKCMEELFVILTESRRKRTREKKHKSAQG